MFKKLFLGGLIFVAGCSPQKEDMSSLAASYKPLDDSQKHVVLKEEEGIVLNSLAGMLVGDQRDMLEWPFGFSVSCYVKSERCFVIEKTDAKPREIKNEVVLYAPKHIKDRLLADKIIDSDFTEYRYEMLYCQDPKNCSVYFSSKSVDKSSLSPIQTSYLGGQFEEKTASLLQKENLSGQNQCFAAHQEVTGKELSEQCSCAKPRASKFERNFFIACSPLVLQRAQSVLKTQFELIAPADSLDRATDKIQLTPCVCSSELTLKRANGSFGG